MHRGVGDHADECLKNIDLVEHVYGYYLHERFTLVENGDCEELCENRFPQQIWETYLPVYQLLEEFNSRDRLVVISGNRDFDRISACIEDNCMFRPTYCFGYKQLVDSLDLEFGNRRIHIEHGHRMSMLSCFPKLERWIVRHFWPLINRYGITEKMYEPWRVGTRISKPEEKLCKLYRKKGFTDLIIGHTHQSKWCPDDGFYNTGCCIRPSLLQCIEISEAGNFLTISLIEWKRSKEIDGRTGYERNVVASDTKVTGAQPVEAPKSTRRNGRKTTTKELKIKYNKKEEEYE